MPQLTWLRGVERRWGETGEGQEGRVGETVSLPVPLLLTDRPDLVGPTKGWWLRCSQYRAFGGLQCLS